MTPNSSTDADVRDALVDRVGEVQVPGDNPISEQPVDSMPGTDEIPNGPPDRQ